MLTALALPAVLLYARTLQSFNPRLDEQTASELARATINDADANGIDARLLVAVIAIESAWDPGAVSAAGARGLGQLMPVTANALGVDPDDPLQNIDGTARTLAALTLRYRDPAIALAAYDAGEGAVARYGGIPPFAETRDYVDRVLRLWARLAGRPEAPRPEASRAQAARPAVRDGLRDPPRAPFPK